MPTERQRTFEVALVAAVSAESVVVGHTSFDSHDGFPPILIVIDELTEVFVQFREFHRRRLARRVYKQSIC